MKNHTKLITSLAALVAVVGIWGASAETTTDTEESPVIEAEAAGNYAEPTQLEVEA